MAVCIAVEAISPGTIQSRYGTPSTPPVTYAPTPTPKPSMVSNGSTNDDSALDRQVRR
jgi:hypothetical protein